MTSAQPATQSAAQISAAQTSACGDATMAIAPSAPVEVTNHHAGTQSHLMSSGEDRGSGRIQLVKPFAESQPCASKGKPPTENNSLRLIAIGSRQTLINNMKMLHMLRYAEIGNWSKLQRGPNPGEFMSVLTLRSPHPWITSLNLD
ncbi:hypothetical protein H6G89_10595 [Oscillatoria sp. FACHB-1407]|uniref:hypothetical protein n=1 Tax=Oscillatoria sp. FACHB-1407 TaxID=2692847 RepID=UPI001688DA89|nr:hypothetical protein [Oscillatoria sp. FACHB-1407]MBD2461497.1 hypothetical protein [Oscillatoria sp. FACHB-1407]